ncbi:hypothetical protein [Krasilnikoviella flava]|uniref:Uncharacterized protein n=1 Tax=Krasilnikoviella flava TaxID=526729 RepID=A0A1T5L6J0_9MICO|nr:hypothetical protein [Krasilnikoviella flava]SKC71553.1 hypothetical protein SAMN04324258_3014 [Krasilnikoviella flava]
MAERSGRRPARMRRVAVLAVVALVGVLAGGGVAWAWWQGEATATAPTAAVRAGTVDVQVVGLGNELVGRGGSVTAPALGLTGAVPGSGDSEIITVRNGGSRPTTVTVTPTRTGSLGTSFTTSASFGAADTGTGCGAGNGTSTTIPAGGTAALCVTVALSASAPSTVQGQAGGVSVALAASLGGTAWTDTGTVVSGAVSAGTVPAPALSCGALGLVSVTFNWTAVPSASRYQFTFGPAATPATVQVPAGTTTYQVTGVAANASARVRAERVFTGGVVWTSVPSDPRTYSIALGLIGTCS